MSSLALDDEGDATALKWRGSLASARSAEQDERDEWGRRRSETLLVDPCLTEKEVNMEVSIAGHPLNVEVSLTRVGEGE